MMRLLVLFAHWCPKCNMMMPIVDEIEVRYGEILEVERVDVESVSEAMKTYGAELIPTFIFYQGKTEVGRMSGMIGEKTFYERVDMLVNK